MSNFNKLAELLLSDPEKMDEAIEKIASASAQAQKEAIEAHTAAVIESNQKTASLIVYGIDRLSGMLTKIAATESHQFQEPASPGPATSIGGDNLEAVPSLNYDKEKITSEEVTAASKEVLNSGDGAAPKLLSLARTAIEDAEGPTHAGASCRTIQNEVVLAATQGKISKPVADELVANLKEMEQYADSIVEA